MTVFRSMLRLAARVGRAGGEGRRGFGRASCVTGVAALVACAAPGSPSNAPSAPRPAESWRAPDASFLTDYAETYRFGAGQPASIHIPNGGREIFFLRSGPRDRVRDLYVYDVESNEARVLLTAAQLLGGQREELSPEERARRERMRSSARGIASYDVSRDGGRILVPLSNQLYLFERRTGEVIELPGEGGAPVDARFAPDGSKVACVRDGDLYVIDLATRTQRKLTTRETPYIVNGAAEFVAQEEMSRFEGYWWSPNSEEIIFQRTDTEGVERMFIADPSHPEREPQAWPYPRPGKQNVRVELGLVSARGGPIERITWDQETYPYLVNVRWTAGAPITLQLQNREQTKAAVVTVAPGQPLRTLFTEEDPAWLNIDQQAPVWLEGGRRLLWTSESQGGWQVVVRDREGAVLHHANRVELGLRELLSVDEVRGRVWVTAATDPKASQVCRLPLEGGEPTCITSGPGWYRAVAAEDHALMVITGTDREGQARFEVVDPEGRSLGHLPDVSEPLPFAPRVEFTDAAGFQAAVVRPQTFEPSARYPVVVYVYGGPGVQVVRYVPRSFLLSQWIADHGFVVVSIDGRGTPGRGRAWERALRGGFVEAPLADQVAGLRALGEAYPEMDLSRVGIWGWSYGGYMSAMAVLRRPDVYRAAVAGAPVTDWLDYDTHYTERYLGLPGGEDDPYPKSSAIGLAEQLQRPLLLVHGTADDNVYFSHTLELSEALFRAGKHHEVLPLSNFTHMVADPVVMRRLYERIVTFMMTHL